MRYYLALLFGLLCAVAASAPPLYAADAVNLSVYQWKKRPLLIFAPSPTDARYRQQIELLNANLAGVTERDIVIGTLFEDSAGAIDGASISALGAARLRQQFGVPAGQFMVLLVGKDGGVKLRSAEPVAIDELFALIDGMPMRQREVRDRGR